MSILGQWAIKIRPSARNFLKSCKNWILCVQQNTLKWNLFFKKKLKSSSIWGSNRKRFSCFVEQFLGGLQKSILYVEMIVLGKMVVVCLENSCLWLPSIFQSNFFSFAVQVFFLPGWPKLHSRCPMKHFREKCFYEKFQYNFVYLVYWKKMLTCWWITSDTFLKTAFFRLQWSFWGKFQPFKKL